MRPIQVGKHPKPEGGKRIKVHVNNKHPGNLYKLTGQLGRYSQERVNSQGALDIVGVKNRQKTDA